MVSLHWPQYGAAAYASLAQFIGTAKAADPLSPVTVVVPNQLTGASVRRFLARGAGGRPGIAGLAVLTADRLAEHIAAPALAAAGRRPATVSVVAAAWRRELALDPGVFAPVASHPSTIRALVRAHQELRALGEAALDALAGCPEPITRDLLRLHRAVSGALAGDWHDVTDLRRTAAELAAGRPGSAHGQVAVFLPQDVQPDTARFLAAVGPLRVIAALTGDDLADAGVIRSVSLLAGDSEPAPAVPPPAVPARIPSTVLHASDADDEVRCVVRLLTAELQRRPGHRIAVLYGAAEPYARLLADHLDAAGLDWNGASIRPVAETALARTLTGVLALPQQGWRRGAVLTVLAGAPILGPDGARVPVTQWDRISRAAGVAGGTEWDLRLKTYAAQQRQAADGERTETDPRTGLIARLERDADAADALRGFVLGLMASLSAGAALTTWPDLAGWASGLYGNLVGDVGDERWLPYGEARAHDRIVRTLEAMAGLGAIEPTADLTGLALVLDLELQADLPRHGRSRQGVLVGPLSAAPGLNADVLYAIGLAEDLVPGAAAGDPLLPDRVRILAGGELPTLHDQLGRKHRQLLAAFAAAPQVVAAFPRGDLRRGGNRLPCRWLLPALRELSGIADLGAGAWERAQGAWLRGSPSFAAGLLQTTAPSSGQEWRTGRLAWDGGLGHADAVLDSATELIAGRAAATLTRYDGDLSALPVPSPADGAAAVSPTSLETWTSCPHAYLVKHLLRVYAVESPEDRVQISPRDVGSLVHEILDRFFRAQPTAPRFWTADHHGLLRETAIAVAAEFEAKGLVGHRVLWQRELAQVQRDLETLLEEDNELRSRTGRQQIRSELAFGGDRQEVRIALRDGRSIRFRGAADRIDRCGTALVIVDYKTGSQRAFTSISEANPTASGSRLQLPVYAAAARAALGEPDAAVSAEYWFIRRDRGQVSLPLTGAVQDAFAQVLTVIADGIGGGLFPHRPAPDTGRLSYVPCEYCDPDGLGTQAHREQWARKRGDPRLAPYLALVEPS